MCKNASPTRQSLERLFRHLRKAATSMLVNQQKGEPDFADSEEGSVHEDECPVCVRPLEMNPKDVWLASLSFFSYSYWKTESILSHGCVDGALCSERNCSLLSWP